MKKIRFPTSSGVWLAIAAAIAGPLAPAVGHAAECSAAPAESVTVRRTLARDWFDRAEAAEATGRDGEAVRAYSCSFEIVAHPFTAYNLARAAERAGDLQRAHDAYLDYLKLSPAAVDRPRVEERADSLARRLAVLAPPALPVEPVEPVSLPKLPSPYQLLPVAAANPTASVQVQPAPTMGTAEWLVGGLGAAALIAGVVFNMGARKAAGQCLLAHEAEGFTPTWSSCDRGERFVYASYALFGVAAVSAGVHVMLRLNRSAAADSFNVALVPGGASIAAGGRF